MDHKTQLGMWVQGISLHNVERDECCPDFSCCNPKMKTEYDDRVKFADAFDAGDEATVDSMLIMFLLQAIETMEDHRTVYIAGTRSHKTRVDSE